MTGRKVWLITGAGRGLGLDIARAALAAGHAVVATGRDAAKVAAAVGHHDNLMAIKLDVTRPQDARAAVEATVAKFAGADAVQTFEAKASTLIAQARAHRELSTSLAYNEA